MNKRFHYPKDWLTTAIDEYDVNEHGTQPIMEAGLVLLKLTKQLCDEIQTGPDVGSAMLAFSCVALMKMHPDMDFEGLLKVMRNEYNHMPNFEDKSLANLKTSDEVH